MFDVFDKNYTVKEGLTKELYQGLNSLVLDTGCIKDQYYILHIYVSQK